MELEKRKHLEAAGIDVQSALERFMNNEMLLERFLKKFLDDPAMDLMPGIDGAYEETCRAIRESFG